MLSVDREAPLRFLRTAYQPDDWVAVFLKSYQSRRTAQRVRPVSVVAAPGFQAWLRAENAMHANVFVSVNSLSPGRRSRTRESVRAIRHVFLEADHDGSQVVAAIDTRLDLPPLSYVLHSSPNRVHVFWRVTGFTIERAEALQKQLARELGTDVAATPCTQTTRVPGFFNHKPQYVPPHLVTIEYRDSTRVFTPENFPTPIAPQTPPVSVRASRGAALSVNPLERARRYLAALPAAIAGQHGDLQTFRVCCRLIRGFALSDAEALRLLTDWNTRCEPPWAEHELRDKLARARRYGREPIGGLLEAHR
jgi:RepB DNA-primase N-terminal domain